MNYIPTAKLSKRQRSVLNNKRRTLWECNPVTKVIPSKKIYNRKRMKNYEY